MSTDEHDRTSGGHRLPGSLVGIGGAGKSVVDRFLSTEWILEEAIAPTEHGEVPEGVRAYVVDTATDERAADEARVAGHNDRIERIAAESGRNPEAMTTDVRYLNPVENALLTGMGAVAGETDEDGDPSAWWLRDDEIPTDGAYGIGTARRRAVGKALLQASQRGDGEMAALPEQLADGPAGRTTIVAGLGGGTGSGMATELAKQIRDAGGRVTLVGILPAVDAHDHVRANAFAALSELEYLAVTGRNPFRNIVLLPHGPASDLGYQDTFFDGVIHTILARENLAKSGLRFDESDASPIPKKFAPFTLVTPQTLRYNVEEIRRAGRSIREYCDAKRVALDAELELYRALEECFRQEWGGDVAEALEAARNGHTVDDSRFDLRDHEAAALRARLDDLRSWLEDEDTFGHVDNQALTNWRDQLGGWIESIREDDADLPEGETDQRLVTRLPGRVDGLDPVDDSYPTEPGDQALASVVRDELRAIGRRAELLRLRNHLEPADQKASDVLAAAVDPEGDFMPRRRLGTVVDEAEHRLHRHRTNRETLDELESVVVEERDLLETSWRTAVRGDIEALVALEANAEAIRARLETIETEVERSLGTIEDARTPETLPWNQFSIDFGSLNERLRAVGIEPVEVDAIERSVEHAAAAFEAWHEYNRDGLLDALPIRDRKADAREQYLARVRAVDDRFVETHPAGDDDLEAPFQCQSSVRDRFDEIRAELDGKRAHHRARLCDELEQELAERDFSDVIDPYRGRWDGDDFDIELPDVHNDASGRIEATVTDGFDAESVDAALDGLLATDPDGEELGVVRAILDEALVEPVRKRRERLDAEASDVERRLERYDRLREIVTDLGIEFDSTGPARPEVSDPSPVGLGSDDPYVTKVEADDQLGLLQYHDIADAGARTDPTMETEQDRIEQYFQKLFADKAVRNADLNGLATRLIEIRAIDEEYRDATNTRYDGHVVTNVFLSRAFPDRVNPEGQFFDDIRDVFERSTLHLGDRPGYNHESIGFGAPWDLSFVTFIGGVFLDNIVGIERYKQAYEEVRSESGDAIRIRHAHGLDGRDTRIGDGTEREYVYRDSLLDLDDPEDLYALLDSNTYEMVETLLGEYVERVEVPDSIDPE